jgi:PAS domain S-box-containing protein
LNINNMLAQLSERFIYSWREYIFTIVFSCILILGIAPLISSVKYAFETQYWLNLTIYITIYIAGVLLILLRNISIKIRSIIGLSLIFVLGALAMHTLGPIGSGRVWLFTFVMLASLLLGVRGCIAALLATYMVIFWFGFQLDGGNIQWPLASVFSPYTYNTTSITFAFLSTLTALAISLLVQSLERNNKSLRESAKVIEERKTQFQQLFTKGPSAQLIIDIDTGKIVDANKKASQFYGWSVEQLKAMHMQDIISSPEEDVIFTINPSKDQKSLPYLSNHKLASGEVRQVEGYSGRVAMGVKEYILSTVNDITERIKAQKEKESLQKQLQQAQKMEAIGTLAGGVAHDYNNISSIIIGYSELALDSIDPEHPLYDDLKAINTAAIRSADITRQLLAFARKQTVAPKVISLNDAVAGVLKMLRRLIGEDIELSWEPADDLWPVKIDPTQIDQILANLCVNSRDAISNVGRVTIETQNISLDDEYCANHAGFLPGDFVILVVSDDGKGIEPDTFDKVFEPFFTTKKLGKGTGLGLSTVYGIAKQNNGFVNLYSEPGQGTSIKVYLPRHLGGAVKTGRINSNSVIQGNGEVILLVEDDLPILKLGSRLLTELNYSVIPASSPTEAIGLAEQHNGKIDLLITDVVMPGMNGRELSNILCDLLPGIKTLYMSGYTANVIAHRGVLEDGVSFIAKPFSKNGLAKKVKEVMELSPD